MLVPAVRRLLVISPQQSFQLHSGAIMLPDPYSLHIVKVVLYMANTEGDLVIAPRHHRLIRAINDSLLSPR